MAPSATIEEVMSLIGEAEEKLRRARELIQRDAPGAAEWMGGYILAEVLQAGGSVQRERLHEIAAKYGMDNRGLGGFFTGRGSLHSVSGTDLVMLTPIGAKTAVQYLPKLAADGEGGVPDLAAAAEQSFAADWEAGDDDVYDRA